MKKHRHRHRHRPDVACVLTRVYVNQDDIAEVLGVNTVTLRNSYIDIKHKGQKQGLFT